MDLYVGTSGYSYKQWKGNFYPEDLSDKKMLGYYSEQFNTVEINNTFYRMPKQNVLDAWKKEVPRNFQFIIKSPKRITHINKLEINDSTEYFVKTVMTLDDKLGVLLFQFPPYFKKDIGKLNTFLESLPPDTRAAFEFRNESWFDDEVFDALKKYGQALCMADTDEKPVKEIISTADWGYLRLRKTNYSAASLKKWSDKILRTGWKKVYVLFKHEDEGKGPKFAKKFMELN